MTRYPITPVAKPRQTQQDRWMKRPRVMRYRRFEDEVKVRRVTLPDCPDVTFGIPMPKSWSKKKRAEHLGQLHRQKPDLDNLWKALSDAIYGDDSHIAQFKTQKVWAEAGYIEVGEFNPF